MAQDSDYKRRKKTWRDIGSARYRHSVKLEQQQALREAARQQQQVTVTSPPTSLPSIPLGAEGSADLRREMPSQRGGNFWESKEFEELTSNIQKDRGRVGRTRRKVKSAIKIDPSPARPEIDDDLRPGQRMYYDPQKNRITYRTPTYLLSEKGDTAVSDNLVPLYTDRNGNLTAQRTTTAALYQIDESVQKAKAMATASARRLVLPSSVPRQYQKYLPKDYQNKIELYKEANKPLVPVGYTNDGEPFYFDERASIQEAREALAQRNDLPWAQKTGLSGLLWAVDTFYTPLKMLERPSLALKSFIESPAVQETMIGRAIDSVQAKGRALVNAAKVGWLDHKYRILSAGNAPPRGMSEEKFWALKQDSFDRLQQADADLQRAIEIARDVENYLYAGTGLSGDNPWGVSSEDELGDIRKLLDNAPKAAEERERMYESAFLKLYDRGDIEGAMADVKRAVQADIRANPWANPYMAYSFRQEPERYDSFLDDVALLTVQKGAPLNIEEINRLRQYHENFWVELSGEAILDPLNLPIVDKIMDSLVGGAKTALRSSLKGAGTAAAATVGKIPVSPGHTVNDVIGYFNRQTTSSMANKVSNTISNNLIQMQRASKSGDEFKTALRELIVPAMQRADSNPRDISRIFEEAKKAQYGHILQNVSLDQFKQMTDAFSIVSGRAAVTAQAKKPGMRILTGDEWSTYLNEALDNYPGEVAEAIARRTTNWEKLTDAEKATLVERIRVDRANTPRFSGEGISKFANDVGKAYIDYHRISTNSRLLDDSLSGMLVSKLRDISSSKSPTLAKKLIGGEGFVRTVEWAMERGAFIRDVWTMAVLSLRPAWIVQNLTDTIMRSMVDGGSLWDDMSTLFFSTQAHLAGQIGVVPMELGQSLSRQGLDFSESVMSRILYEGWKPNFGVFSYWNFERQRLRKGAKEAADLAMRGMPEGWRKSAATLSNWFKTDIGTAVHAIPGGMQDLNTSIEFTIRLRMFNREYFKLLKTLEPKFTGKLLDEVPEHLKVIANQIWKLAQSNPAKVKAYTESLAGELKGRAYWSFIMPPNIDESVIGMTAFDQENFLTPVRMQLDNLVEEVLKSGREPNPDDFKVFFDKLIDENRTATEQRLSDSMRLRRLNAGIDPNKAVSDIPNPEYVGRVYKGSPVMDDVYGHGTLYTTSEEYAKNLANATKSAFSGGEIRLSKPYIVDDAKKLQDLGKKVYDDTLAATKSKRQAKEASDKFLRESLEEKGYDGILIRRPNGTEDIVAFFPGKQFQSDEKLRRLVVQDAVKKLRAPAKGMKGDDFLKNYSDAMRGVAEIVSVPDSSVVQVVAERGKITISVGDAVLKDTPNLKSRLVDATQQAMYRLDEGYIKSKNLFANETDYLSRFRSFTNDPTRALKDNPTEFRFFAQQMKDYPSVRGVIEHLRGRRVRFEELDALWEKWGRSIGANELYTPEGKRAFFRQYAEQLDEIHMAPAEFRQAGDELRETTVRLGSMVGDPGLPIGLRNSSLDVMNKWGLWRERLANFFRDATPGPLRTAPGFSSTRPKQWDMYYSLRVDGYKVEANFKTQLADMIESGKHEEAEAFLKDWQDNFLDNFLREHNITYELASDGRNLYTVSMPLLGRRVAIQDAFSIKYFIASFLSGDVDVALDAVPPRLRRIIPEDVYDNLYEAVYRNLGANSDEADAIIRLLSDRADQWSAATNRPITEYLHRLGVKSDGVDNGLFRAYLGGDLDDLGKSLPFGLHRASVEEMVSDAAKNFLEDIRTATAYSKDATRYFRNVSEFVGSDGSIDYSGFAKQFLEYVTEGKFGHKGKSRLFERYKSYLADIHRAVVDTPLEERLDSSVNEFLATVTRDVDLMPARNAEVHMIKVMADELGLPNTKKDILKVINDDVQEVVDVNWTQKLTNRRADIDSRLAEFRTGQDAARTAYGFNPERPRTIADDIAEQGGISPVAAEFIGQEALRQGWSDEFVVYLTQDIQALPEPMRVVLDDRLMKAFEGHPDGLKIYRYNVEDIPRDLFVKADGTHPYTEAQLREMLAGGEAVAWTKSEGAKNQFIAYLTESGSYNLPHEMVHILFDDMMANPTSKALLDDIIQGTKKEASAVLDNLLDENWHKELEELANTGELAQRIRDNYTKLRDRGYAAHFRPDVRSDDEIYAQLDAEMNKLLEDVMSIREGGQKAYDSIMIDYMSNAREFPLLAIMYGHTDRQFFSVALLEPLAKKTGMKYELIFDQEIVAYSLIRYSPYRNDYDKVLPLFETFLGKEATERFSQMEDVPIKYAREALYRQAQKKATVPLRKPTINIEEEMQAAWEAWSTARNLRRFGKESDRESVHAFRDFLRREMLDPRNPPGSEVHSTLRQMMWQVEQFEAAVMKFHKGDELAEALTPVIPEAMIDEGIQTWIRNNEYNLGNMMSAERALKEWRDFLMSKATGKDPLGLRRLTAEEMDAMRKWADKATNAKAELVGTIINGGSVDGKRVTGAVEGVNRVMLDYQTRNNFDQLMSNFFPFWMFPSRSWPFWVETLAAHPKLIALYMKIKRASQSARYQAGAVNSKGEPLPSLEGYLPIQLPGMKEPAWVNPLAPFSFRYVLDPMNLMDDMRYELQSQDSDIPPMTFLTKHILESSTTFGFYPAPWITWGLKSFFDIPDYVLPQFPVLPQISLIPRWRIPDMIRLGNRTYATNVDEWYPEASWHDYLVEREILRDALQKVQSGTMSDSQKQNYLREIEQAIRDKKGNQVWDDAYKAYTETESSKSVFAYFTGIFTKEFSDSDADMYALRNEMNMYKAALQNEVQMRIFFDETDQDYAMYDRYINARNTPRGYLYQMYSDIGWIQNDAGLIEKDPDKRAKLLALKIDQRRNNNAYHDAMAMYRAELEDRLSSLPIGAPWEQVQPHYDWYARMRGIAESKYDPSFEYYGSSKSAGRIADDVSGRWYDYVWATRPRWNPEKYETYKDYEAKIAAWERDLPELTKVLLSHFKRSDPYVTKVLENLKDTQKLPPGFLTELQQGTTSDAMEQWRRQNKDDVFDALNNAWEEMYWNPYWDAVEGLNSYERTYAEMQFLEEHPRPPSAEEMYAWIQERYGDRFTLEEIKKWVSGSNEVLSVDERRESTQTNAEKIKDDIWDMLSWVQPGGTVRDQFEEQAIRNGVERDFFTKWYENVYQDETELRLILRAVQNAIMTLDLNPPSRTQLAEWVIAKNLNDDFTQLKKQDLPSWFENEYNYYNELEYDEKKQYRRDNEMQYRIFQDYYRMRDAFALSNPVWAKYYNPKMYKPGTEVGQAIPSDSIVQEESLSLSWPAGMKSRISPLLIQNIEAALQGGRLSSYDVTYLEQLANTHPTWRKFISEVIARGE